MSRTWSFFLVLLLLIFPVLLLPAQEEEGPQEESPGSPPIESDWSEYNASLYAKGDKTFIITLGLIFPTIISGTGIEHNEHGMSLGGTGSLAFNYYLSPHFFMGGEISGMFMGTRAKNMMYMVPFGIRLGYQFLIRRFEFPFTLMIGGAHQRYLQSGYFGLIIKGGVSAFWRFSPDWSFGLNTAWWFVPQWPKSIDGIKYKANGNFLELTLSARYHF